MTMLHENTTKKIIINDELELTEFHQELMFRQHMKEIIIMVRNLLQPLKKHSTE